MSPMSLRGKGELLYERPTSLSSHSEPVLAPIPSLNFLLGYPTLTISPTLFLTITLYSHF